jgi:hypothetical protein
MTQPISWAGAYGPSTTYAYGDVVSLSNRVYLCIDPSGATGVDPTANRAVWQLLSLADPTGSVVAPEDFGAKGDGVRFFDGAITSGSTTLSTALASSSSIGQRVYVSGAGASGAGFSSTVTAVGSGTLTLASAATTTVSGKPGWFGTDDTSAFQAAINALGAAGGSILCGARNYVLHGNSSLSSPANSVISVALNSGVIEITGAPGGNQGRTQILTTRVSDTYSGTGEPPALVGMEPISVFPFAYGGFVIRNVTLRLPDDPTIGAVNAHWAAKFNADKVAVTTASRGKTTPEVIYPTHKWNVGIRLPGGGFGDMKLGYVVVQGTYCGFGIVSPSHLVIEHALPQTCVVGYGFEDSAGGGHTGTWTYAMSEYNNYHIGGWDPVNGAKSPPGPSPINLQILLLDIEDGQPPFDTIDHVLDANSIFGGNLWFNYWNGLGLGSNLDVNGATNINLRQLKANPPRSQVFTSNGTWYKPSGVTYVRVDAIGGGGGGAFGGTGSSSSSVAGGWGGQAGGYSSAVFAASDLPSYPAGVSVTVGIGGTGSPGTNVPNTPPGSTGTKNGTPSTFGSLLSANGGSALATGSFYGQGTVQQGAEGGASASGAAGIQGGSEGMAGAGGSGGGISTGSAKGGGMGGVRVGQSYTTGAAPGTNGASSPVPSTALGGGGGGGGNASASSNGSPGGNGGMYGGGGGGGGACLNTKTSGSGGNGGDGTVVVTAW